jgi:hypothetical protein
MEKRASVMVLIRRGRRVAFSIGSNRCSTERTQRHRAFPGRMFTVHHLPVSLPYLQVMLSGLNSRRVALDPRRRWTRVAGMSGNSLMRSGRLTDRVNELQFLHISPPLPFAVHQDTSSYTFLNSNLLTIVPASFRTPLILRMLLLAPFLKPRRATILFVVTSAESNLCG